MVSVRGQVRTDTMAEERVQRRLAAILAADVVGFSRMMGEDEAGTLAQLKTLRRELFEPKTAQRAVSLDDSDAFAHFVLSRGLDLAGRIEQALHEAKLAVELNPNDAGNLGSLGSLLISSGQPDEGIAALHRARHLSPKGPQTYLFVTIESRAHFVAGRYDEAATAAKDALNRRSGDPAMRALLAASLGNAGRGDEARSVLAHGEPLDPAFLDQPWAVYGLRGIDPERLVDGLRKAGWEG